jgi:hypothetical protein
VLRAYFDAWSHNDAPRQQTFMTSNYARLVSEPVDSLQVLSINPQDPATPSTRTFAVSFDIKTRSPGASVPTGRHQWTYTLTWDAKKESWLISNYGAG